MLVARQPFQEVAVIAGGEVARLGSRGGVDHEQHEVALTPLPGRLPQIVTASTVGLLQRPTIRWPPVIFTIGTSYFSATSAIFRSWAGVVTPPLICGTTENVPSRWMLACTRSLMNSPSFSGT